jgi:hypothetical protein
VKSRYKNQFGKGVTVFDMKYELMSMSMLSFEVFMAVMIPVKVFWAVMPCSVVSRYQRFRGPSASILNVCDKFGSCIFNLDSYSEYLHNVAMKFPE